MGAAKATYFRKHFYVRQLPVLKGSPIKKSWENVGESGNLC